MKAYATLMKLRLLDRLSFLRRGSWRKPDGRWDVQRIVLTPLIAAGLLGLLAGMVWLEWFVFRALAGIGQVWLLPALALMAAMVCTLVMGFFQVMSQLFFSKDVALMASLPVRSVTVLASRLTGIWLGEAAMTACIFLPAAVMCGVHLSAGAGYWLTAAALTLLAPMLPLSVLTLLSALLARVTAFFRHREALMMVGSILMVILVMTAEISLISVIPEDADAMFFMRLLLDKEALLSSVTSAFPLVAWGVNALRGQGLQLGLFALVSLGSLMAVTALTGPGYLSLALFQQERSARRKTVRTAGKAVRASGQLAAFYRLEMRMLLRTPAYAFNGVYGALVFPLIMVYMVVISQFSEEMTGVVQLLTALTGRVPVTDRILVLAGVAGFCCCMNPAAATAVSREGKRFMHTCTLPVKPGTLLWAKFLSGMTVSLLTSVGITAVYMIILPLRAEALCAWLVAQLLSAAAVGLSLAWDAAHPLLNWPSETFAIKQNNNVLIGMLCGVVVVGLPAGLAFLLLDASAHVRFAAVLAVCAAETLAACLCLQAAASRKLGGAEASQ